MTVSTFETAIGGYLNVPKKAGNQRNGECACILGGDIGAYDTCGHLCRYCYANSDTRRVLENRRMHDPASPFLIGNYAAGDVIHDVPQESWEDRQMSIFDLNCK